VSSFLSARRDRLRHLAVTDERDLHRIKGSEYLKLLRGRGVPGVAEVQVL
jgi:hypothetical protein